MLFRSGGGGSSNVNKSHIVDISTGLEQVGFVLDRSLKDLYTKYNAYQEALLVDPKATDWERLSYRRYVYPEMDLMPNKTLVGEQAKSNDMAVVVIGRGSTEESDRKVHDDFNLSDSEIYMIDKVCEEFHARNKKVVVLLNIGGVVETASWKNKPDAILSVWFPGQECGHAVADVLTGTVNPSGKLPMTFPVRYSDIPSSKNYPTECVTLRQEIEVQERQNENVEKFIQTAHKYVGIDKLDGYALRELVSAIYVDAPDKSSGKRVQHIHIQYDGLGFIPLNELMKEETA